MLLTVLGGSSVASPALINALVARPRRPSLRVVLHGRDESKLERVGQICATIASLADDIHISWTTDLSRALDGADLILNQIRVGGLQARAFDESFAHQFDIPGEETIGPGGFANAWRTLPVCIAYARQIETYAPNAWLVNLTNPAGMIQAALARTSPLRVVSVCDSPVALINNIAALLGVPPRELSADYVGMLHFGFVVGVTHNGVNVMPRVLENIAQLPGLVVHPQMVQAMGVVPGPYLNYFLAPDLMLSRQRAHGRTRAVELQALEAQILDEYAAGNFTQLEKRAAVWYEKIIVPVMLSLMGHDGDHIVNTPNEGTVPLLPPATIVETRALVTSANITPYPTAPVPTDVMAMLQTNAAYEALVVEAALEQSYDKAWRALRLNPLVSSTSQARAILDLVLSHP